MVLFPESVRALEAVAGAPPVAVPDAEVAAVQEQRRAQAAAEPREDVAEVRDVDADGVRCRLHRPAGHRHGTVVHWHGGGFVYNDIDVHDASARRLANRSGLAVLSVGYRRPPEHPFPAAVDDSDAVLAWLAREGAGEGLAGPLLAHGDSAGGNLALVAALRHPGRFAAAALVYPFLDPEMASESWRTETQGFGTDEGRWYWERYAGPGGDRTHPDLAPLRSDRLGTLPPTLVTTAEHDPLRDEGELLARRIAAAGGEVVATRYLGQLHGFWRHPSAFPAAEPLMEQVAAFLRRHAG
ncbi:alpha/beta hydrolase [Nocardioides taihuensis]|uniref:Alpha/beta hydrolase n=1 Tax=Nocardioides taihuensis TaxID=1835606 RepID=A0ABW0BPZ8_9ACTN